MSLFTSLACALGLHSPNRRKVQWDGKNYRGKCRHCGAPVVRVARKTWRKAAE